MAEKTSATLEHITQQIEKGTQNRSELVTFRVNQEFMPIWELLNERASKKEKKRSSIIREALMLLVWMQNKRELGHDVRLLDDDNRPKGESVFEILDWLD